MQRGEIASTPLVVFLVVKPGRRVRTWIEGLEGPIPPADRTLLLQRTGAITVGDVEAPITIGIVSPRKGEAVNAFDLPMPVDWQAAMTQAGRPLRFPEELLAIVWPD